MLEPITLTKIATCDNPRCQTAAKDEYNLGRVNDKSPFVGYEIRGELLGDIQLGEQIRVARTHRNGVEMEGFFASSHVQKIEEDVITTDNSVYKIVYERN